MNLESIWNTLKNLDYSGVPIGKIITVIVILTLAQTLRRFVIAVIVKTIERFTRNTETTLDDDNLYFEAEKNLNLAILRLLEQEEIDFLHVELRTDPERYKQSQNAMNN